MARGLPYSAGVLAVVGVALALMLLPVACGGADGAGGPDAAAVRSCLQAEGFDTSESTGLIGIISGGETIEMRDEFAALREGEEFLVVLLNNEEDAQAVADVLRQQGNVPSDYPRVEGAVVLGYSQAADPQALESVEDCLGL